MGIVSADAESCYDRIAHVFASLVFQAVGVGITAVMAMLLSIQHMKFYLRTGLGESVSYMTAALGSIIQGLCQGNTAAPAGWSLISAVLIQVYKLFGHGAFYETPITRKSHNTAGVWYVDDADLFTMNSGLATRELWAEVARSTKTWTELLTVPGRSGKGEKCFGYMIDYEWDVTGAWYYAPVPDMQLEIVLPDGSTKGIVLLPHTAPRVTLGINSSPATAMMITICHPQVNQGISGNQLRPRLVFGWIVLKTVISPRNTRGSRIDYSCGAVLGTGWVLSQLHCIRWAS
jgi:hypothetical protein